MVSTVAVEHVLLGWQGETLQAGKVKDVDDPEDCPRQHLGQGESNSF